MSKKYNPNLISIKRSYTINQLCQVYAGRKLHKQTVRKWLKKGSLKYIPNSKKLIHGSEIKTFLENKNKSDNPDTKYEHFKCFKCKGVSIPCDQKISISLRENGTLRAVGVCGLCGWKVNKIYKGGDVKKLEQFFKVKQHVEETIYDCSDSSLKTHNENTCKTTKSEPIKKKKPNTSRISSNAHNSEQQMNLF